MGDHRGRACPPPLGPLRIRPGLGTISNVIVIGVVLDITLAILDTPEGLAAAGALLVAGILLNALATGVYIAASFGPGPRDGLMTGLTARGLSVRGVRTGIEIIVVIAGALLGGTVGVGTLLYALGIGPLVASHDAAVRRPRAPGVSDQPRKRSRPLARSAVTVRGC